MELNSYQTVLDETSIDREVYAEMVEFISTVKFIQDLISKDRRRISDLERDELGRIKVDITNPHILEDMDYFRPAALHYNKFKKYTNLFPNPHSTSSYYKFWKEEARRCREGYIREYDGEWIPGPYYFYLNYSPILKSKVVSGSKKAERYKGFPDVYDGSYLHYHYIEQAKWAGKHCGELKRRGVGFSYEGSSGLTRLAVLGDTSFNKEGVKSFAIASEKEYLIKDGILNKFEDNIDWCASTTPWPRLKSKDSLNNMVWEFGYVDSDGLTHGTRNSVIGVTTQGNPEHAHPYSELIVTPSGIKRWESIKIGDVVFSCNGSTTKVVNTIEFGEKDVYKIDFKDGRSVSASGDHRWDIGRRKTLWENKKSCLRVIDEILTTIELEKLLKLSSPKFPRIKIADAVEFPVQNVPIEPYTLGLLLGDGTLKRVSNTQSPITMKWSDFDEIKEYIPYNTRHENWGGDIRNLIYIPNGRKLLEELKLNGKTSGDKFIPNIYKFNSKEVRFSILSGLLDADGCIGKDFGTIEYSTKSKQLAEDFIWILRSLGINGKIGSRITKGTTYYRCWVYCDPSETRLFKLPRKYERISMKKYNSYANSKRKFTVITKVSFSHREKVKCITVDSPDSKYLIGDFIPTLNCRGKRGPIYYDEWGLFPNLLKTWNIARESVEEGDFAHSIMIGGGTGGTESADFAGAEEMFYNATGYNILDLPNVYDKNTNGQTRCAFFFPAYLNRLGKYDKDGNSDVIGALIEIIQRRVNIKYNSTDPNTLVQHKAEMCITPQEAVLRREGSIFPVSDLKDYLAEVLTDYNKFVSAHYVGHLKVSLTGAITWDKEELHPPLRNYPLRDELDKIGCVEIFEMPRRMQDGTIPSWRYLAGLDPIDVDASLYTNSLGSIFVFDTWTNRIVAEYSGRPRMAAEFYDICVRLLRFYNAIANYENNLKGLFQYFDTTRNLQYLCDTPQVLRDMDYIKGATFGNRSKGTCTNKMINAWGRKLQADWLIGQAYTPFDDDDSSDEQGNIIERPSLLNLHKVRSIGYLRELIRWNPDDNFDRISAMGMLMVLKADREKYEQYRYEDKIKTVLDDPWFKSFGGFSGKTKIVNPAKSVEGLRYIIDKKVVE